MARVKKYVACRRGNVWKLGVAIQVVEHVRRGETISHGWNMDEAWEKAFPDTKADSRFGDHTETLKATALKEARAELATIEAAWSKAVMARAAQDDAVPITVTKAELQMLLYGVDSHRYWNLSDEEYRNSGYVMDPGSDDPETAEKIEEFDALEAKLEEIKRSITEVAK